LKKLTRGLSAEREFGSGSDISSASAAAGGGAAVASRLQHQRRAAAADAAKVNFTIF